MLSIGCTWNGEVGRMGNGRRVIGKETDYAHEKA
jgi:hypothetical protein